MGRIIWRLQLKLQPLTVGVSIGAREAFRATNYVSPCATATIAGFGARGYLMALDAALQMID